MKRNIILLGLIAFCASRAYTQERIDSDIKIPAHQNVKGTQIWMVPPQNFVASTRFKGFEDATNPFSTIMVTEMPAPYPEIAKAFDGEKPLPNGMTLQKNIPVQVKNLDGMLLEIEQSLDDLVFKKHILIAGDVATTIMINGICPKDSLSIEAAICQSLRTIYYDGGQVVNSRDSMDYAIDETGTPFQFASVVGNALIFTMDGKMPTQSKDKTVFFADKSFSEIYTEDQKQFCMARLKKMPYTKTTVNEKQGLKKIKIDWLEGYELLATAYDEDTAMKEFVYQAIIFDDRHYYIFYGTSEKDNAKTIAAWKKIARSFKRK